MSFNAEEFGFIVSSVRTERPDLADRLHAFLSVEDPVARSIIELSTASDRQRQELLAELQRTREAMVTEMQAGRVASIAEQSAARRHTLIFQVAALILMSIVVGGGMYFRAGPSGISIGGSASPDRADAEASPQPSPGEPRESVR